MKTLLDIGFQIPYLKTLLTCLVAGVFLTMSRGEERSYRDSPSDIVVSSDAVSSDAVSSDAVSSDAVSSDAYDSITVKVTKKVTIWLTVNFK